MLITENTVDANNGSKKITSMTVAAVILLVVCLLCALVSMIPSLKDEPQIVAAIVAPVTQQQQQMKKKTVIKQLKQTASASAASPIAKMIRANTTAKIAAPEVTKVSDGPVGFGEGDLGDGFGAGDGTGMGSGAEFFGSKSTGRRFLFVLDHSGSMKPDQVSLRDREIKKALQALPSSADYQVLLFAGGCMYAENGWKLEGSKFKYDIVSPNNKRSSFYSTKGYKDYEVTGGDSNLPKANWLKATSSNVRNTINFMGNTKLFAGTDWELALRTAHLMSPPPDVIFFMSDGSGGNDPGPILKTNRKHGRPKINTFAMQTSIGAKEFNEVAQETGGDFVIVAQGGKTINGKEYFKNPSKFSGILR